MNLESSLQIFKKYSNIKFHENRSSGGEVVPCRRRGGRKGQTKRREDRPDEANSLFSKKYDLA